MEEIWTQCLNVIYSSLKTGAENNKHEEYNN